MSNSEIIMIIDDTPANLEVLEAILYNKGYMVLAFPRGDMAIRAAKVSAPDLILLDVMMPGMNGFEVCRKLKEDYDLKDIPVIFISALDDSESKVKAFLEGGVDYITKPFQESEVLARIKAHINLRNMRKTLLDYNHNLEELVQEKVEEIFNSQMSTLVAISKLAEYRDESTGKHIERTQLFCCILAQELRNHKLFRKVITEDFIKNIFYAASLHDVGKIGISDQILLKKGKLTPEEFDIMKTHVTIGKNALKEVLDEYPQNEFIKLGIELTTYHHEKWDGTGYPEGLSRENIPVSARIMAIVDVYDALRSKRPYKEGFSHSKSLEILKEGEGKHFDPEVLNAFLAVESKFDALY